MEKGVTQCYLPGCNRFTWPFQNYCCREHEELGKKMGLPCKIYGYYIIVSHLGINNIIVYVAPSLTSTTISASTSIQNDSSMCLLPGCTRPKYVDTMSGITRDYCCSTHATQAAVASKRGESTLINCVLYIILWHLHYSEYSHKQRRRTEVPQKISCPKCSLLERKFTCKATYRNTIQEFQKSI